MALQIYTLTLGNLKDDQDGNNYSADTPVYIVKSDGSFASIYSNSSGSNLINQNGIDNLSNSSGEFTFFVESGQYIVRVNGKENLINVIGSTYFDSRVKDSVSKIIEETQSSRGFRVVGAFADGFTYELFNDVGIDTDGNSWIYVGAGAPNKTVTAGTVPSTPNYEQVVFNDHNALANRDESGSHPASAITNEDGTTAQDTANKLSEQSLPDNDFNKAVTTGLYLGFGDGAGAFSSSNAPDGSGNVRFSVSVKVQDGVIFQDAVVGNANRGLWYYRSSFVGSSANVEDALSNAKWNSLPTLTAPNLFEDTVSSNRSMLDIEHNSDGSGAANGQTYGLDVHNNPNSKSAVVVHQYSNNGPAIWLDNTDDSAMVRINNTKNINRNPDHPNKSEGSFFELQDENFTQWELTHDYVWRVYKTPKWLALGSASAGEFISPSTKAEPTVKIDRDYNEGAAGSALAITTDGGSGINVAQNGPGFAFSAACGSGAAGYWSMSLSGYDFGARFSTESGSGAALRVEKGGTSVGDAFEVIDSGVETFAIEKEGVFRISNADNMQTSVGAAGAASALPATPDKYLKIKDESGQIFLIPMFKA